MSANEPYKQLSAGKQFQFFERKARMHRLERYMDKLDRSPIQIEF